MLAFKFTRSCSFVSLCLCSFSARSKFKKCGLYLLEDIERDDSLITNELELIEDDGNTFTGEQTNGNDDYEIILWRRLIVIVIMVLRLIMKSIVLGP